MSANGSARGPILVVEDDSACRELITTLLACDGFETCEASTAEEALELVQRERPAVVIADVVLPAQSGYELCRLLREQFGETLPIMFVSGERTDPLDLVAGFLIGADDYITKPFTPEEIVARVQRALIRSAGSSPENAEAKAHDLTAREREVLSLLADGFSQIQIAGLLVISSKTVATHIQRILGKLDLHSRAEAVAWAYRKGLVGVGGEADR